MEISPKERKRIGHREKAFEQQVEDAKKQVKLIKALNARAVDPRTGDVARSTATTDSSGHISSNRATAKSCAETLQRTREQVNRQQDSYGEIQSEQTQQLQITALKKDLKSDEKQLKMMLANIHIWEDFQNQGYTNDRQQALDEAKEEAIKLTTQI